MRKLIWILLFATQVMGCDSDFRQGNCDEGFFEQTDGNGGSFCVPITEEGAVNTEKAESNWTRN